LSILFAILFKEILTPFNNSFFLSLSPFPLYSEDILIMISSIAIMVLTACGICPLLLVEINEKAIGLMTYCLSIIADM